jgi:P4 family phage/plasmid primase-like protien
MMEMARTCNEACALQFPQAARHCPAFIERECDNLNEPGHLELLDLNDDFWVLTLDNAVFVQSEDQFRQYNPLSGIYAPVQECTLIQQIISNLNLCAGHFPSRLNYDSFTSLKNRTRLKAVVERARDLLAVDDGYFQDRKHLHLSLANGVLQIDNSQFYPSDPAQPVKKTLPVKYDPEAKCEVLLKSFLAHILEQADIDLLQRYLSQVLEGINHSQSILVLTGDSGWGKSSLMKILGSVVGWNRVGIVREQLFKNEFELSHYANKNFLFHPDMPTDFLNRPEASLFKQLVGGDPLWCDVKANDERMVVEGNFPIVLACNGKPRIHIDEDAPAWLRRLVVLSFKQPSHEQHFGKMAELILKQESSGILNWLLAGRAKLVKDKLQLTLTREQKARTATLLMGSESPSAFVRSALVKKKDGVTGAVDLYEKYQMWCRTNQLQPFAYKKFQKTVKADVEINFGLKYRHDLVGENGKAMRGWKGLALVEGTVQKSFAKESSKSDQVLGLVSGVAAEAA